MSSSLRFTDPTYARALLKFSLAKNAKYLNFVLAFYELHFYDVCYQKSKSDTNKDSQYNIEREAIFHMILALP